MEKEVFSISTDNIDVSKIIDEIKKTVARKTDEGLYSASDIVAAERSNIEALHKSADFTGKFIKSLRNEIIVDINDFPIHERRRVLGAPLRWMKVSLWKLLKFYTYRLWSQQNHINGLLLTALDGIEDKYSARIKELEARISELEQQTGEKGTCPQSEK
ncbi:MAG: hypothetical protein GX811_02740 [Lentisphaerae bacterium]|nr:hypothetical protein [Lentisphaerota bacterium]